MFDADVLFKIEKKIGRLVNWIVEKIFSIWMSHYSMNTGTLKEKKWRKCYICEKTKVSRHDYNI